MRRTRRWRSSGQKAVSESSYSGSGPQATQLEVSRTDAFTLGINPPVVNPAISLDTPGITIKGPAGEVTIEEGVIVAARHIHFHTSDAERWGIADKQTAQGYA